MISGVQTGTVTDKRAEFVELVNCGEVAVSLAGCKLRYRDAYTYRNLSGVIPPWHFYLIANANGPAAAQADDLFWISFSQDHSASVTVECAAGAVDRVSWFALGGFNFTRLEGELLEVTLEEVPARNSAIDSRLGE